MIYHTQPIPLRDVPVGGYCVHEWDDRRAIYRVRKHRGRVVDETLSYALGWSPLNTSYTLSSSTLVRPAYDHELVARRARALEVGV